jgi:hypothetical protein
MHEYYLIKESVEPVLDKLGFVEDFEEVRPDIFGSIHSLWRKLGVSVRLIWDGKEGMGYAQVSQTKGEWKDIKPYIPEGTESDFRLAISELTASLSDVLAEDLRTGVGDEGSRNDA